MEGFTGQVPTLSGRVVTMQNTAIEIWIYGVIIILGGIMGFVKVGSKASLISGVGMGLALLACGYGVSRGSVDSLMVAVVIAALLLVIFADSFRQDQTIHAGWDAGDSQFIGSGDFWGQYWRGIEESRGRIVFRWHKSTF